MNLLRRLIYGRGKRSSWDADCLEEGIFTSIDRKVLLFLGLNLLSCSIPPHTCKSQHSAGGICKTIWAAAVQEAHVSGRLPTYRSMQILPAECWDLQTGHGPLWAALLARLASSHDAGHPGASFPGSMATAPEPERGGSCAPRRHTPCPHRMSYLARIRSVSAILTEKYCVPYNWGWVCPFSSFLRLNAGFSLLSEGFVWSRASHEASVFLVTRWTSSSGVQEPLEWLHI